VPNAEHAHQNRQSVLFSIERGRQVQNEEFSLLLFNATDLTITSKSWLSF